MARTADIGHELRRLNDPQEPLGVLYTVSGDEPLLVTEAMDGLRAAATRRNYNERTSLVLDARSDWSAVMAATRNNSLFGDSCLVDLKIPTGKPGKTGGDVLAGLADSARRGEFSGVSILVSLPRLDKATRGSKWATQLADAGAFFDIADIQRGELPRWIGQRLARQNQSADPASLEWLADMVEGNLLAAFQEIQKLALLYPEGAIGIEDLERAVLNVARYDVFGLRDAMLTGHASKALTMLSGLRAEGEALPLVLWALGDDIRIMARLQWCRDTGQDASAAMRKHRLFGSHERAVRQAMARVHASAWPGLVQHAHDIDRIIKGLKVPGRLDDPWAELALLVMRVAQPAAAKK
jgi:DNA polymerase-3 subunit delta